MQRPYIHCLDCDRHEKARPSSWLLLTDGAEQGVQFEKIMNAGAHQRLERSRQRRSPPLLAVREAYWT